MIFFFTLAFPIRPVFGHRSHQWEENPANYQWITSYTKHKKNKTTRIHDTFSPWTFFGDFVQRKVMHNQQIKHWCLSLLRFWNSATAASDIYTGVSLYKQLTPHATVPTFNVSLSIRLYQRSSSVGSTDSNQSTSIFTILQSTSSSSSSPHFSHYFTHDLLWNKHF